MVKMRQIYTLPDKIQFWDVYNFYPHLLAQFRQQIQKERARNISSTNFQTYILYKNEVMGFQTPFKMNTVIHEGKNGLWPLQFNRP